MPMALLALSQVKAASEHCRVPNTGVVLGVGVLEGVTVPVPLPVPLGVSLGVPVLLGVSLGVGVLEGGPGELLTLGGKGPDRREY